MPAALLAVFLVKHGICCGQKQTSNIPSSLQELIALKKRGYKIGVVDDPYETAARLIGDSKKVCGKSPGDYVGGNIFDILSNCRTRSSRRSKDSNTGDFVSALEDLLKIRRSPFTHGMVRLSCTCRNIRLTGKGPHESSHWLRRGLYCEQKNRKVPLDR